MLSFNKMSIQMKVSIFSFSFLFLVVVQSFVSFVGIQTVNSSVRDIYELRFQGSNQVMESSLKISQAHMNMLQMIGNITSYSEYSGTDFNERKKNIFVVVDESLATFTTLKGKLSHDEQSLKAIETLIASLQKYRTAAQSVIEVLAPNDASSSDTFLPAAEEAYKAAAEQITLFKSLQDDQSIKDYARVNSLGQFNTTVLGISFVLLLLMVVAMFLTVNAYVSQPIDKLSKAMGQIAAGSGDLTQKLHVKSEDEIGQLAGHFNKLIDNLCADMLMVKEIAEGMQSLSQGLSAASRTTFETIVELGDKAENLQKQAAHVENKVEDIADQIHHLSKESQKIRQNVEHQTRFVETSAAAVNQIAASISSIHVMAAQSLDISKELQSVAATGGETVDTALKAIQEIAENSEKISAFLTLISSIAEQTNILAMNAAIEASHAGESGMGFSVVADEILRLAADSSRNAQEIGSSLNLITEKIAQALNRGREAGESLSEIITSSDSNAQTVSLLTSALSEQETGAKEASTGLTELHKLSQQIAVSVQKQDNAFQKIRDAMDEIKEQTLATKNDLESHQLSMEALEVTMKQVDGMIDQNTSLNGQLFAMVEKFKLE